MNYLIRQIGIFYYNKEWAKQLFDTILHEIPPETINKYSSKYLQIAFKDGSCLNFVNANIPARGRKFSEIYIQDGIDVEIYRYVILPCLNPRKAKLVQIIRNAEDIFTGYLSAKEYYDSYNNKSN